MSLTIPIKPLMLVGSSGSGRSAIIYHLITTLPHKFERVISHTTRKPRPNQKDGFHFHFVNEEYVNRKIQTNKFITTINSPNSNFYGLSEKQIMRVLQNDKIPIFRMTLEAYKKNIKHTQNGKIFINKSQIQCHCLYINIQDIAELQRRLQHGPFSQQQCKIKVETAKREEAEAGKYFMKEDMIESVDMDETLVKVKSRLFQLY